MKKTITQKKVKHIANLAKIKLSSEEIEKFQKQLGDIIKYFDKLNEVDTEDVEETSQVTGLTSKMRKDEARDFLSQKKALENAPDEEDGYFRTKSSL